MRAAIGAVVVAVLTVVLAGCPGPETPAAIEPMQPEGATVEQAQSGGFSEGVTVVDEMAPDFVLLDTDGNEVTKAEFTGTVLVLDFWATWCKPCVKKLKEYEPILAKYADKGVELVAVSLDSKPEVAAGWAKENQFPYRVVMFNDEFKDAYFPEEDTIAVPQVRLIDRDGNLRYKFSANTGAKDLELALAELVEETVGGDESVTNEVLSELGAEEPGEPAEDTSAPDAEGRDEEEPVVDPDDA